MTRYPLLAAGLMLALCAGCHVQQASAAFPVEREQNLLHNAGFEHDRHHNGAEGHVLAFMGDWSFKASDLKPDYWTPSGTWEYAHGVAHTGERSLLLKAGAGASMGILKAAVNGNPGGGDRRWGNPGATAISYDKPERLARTVRGSVWYRGDSAVVLTIGSSGVSKSVTAEPSPDDWARAEVEITRAEIEQAYADGSAKDVQRDQTFSVKAEGGTQVYIDDVRLAEDHGDDMNLATNGSFEQVDGDGYPQGWSQPMKYRFYTQQYYKWTSWHHFFEGIRGPVATTDLVSRSGGRSLLMQVYPGDEMLVEGPLATLNQTEPGIVEIGAYVKLDGVKWIDIRAVDADGNEIPCVDAFRGGWPVPQDGTQIYPSNASEWVYVRKAFITDKPLKGIRPRLCARGFNGDTRDDGGTRPMGTTVGLAWWDDVRVVEVTATNEELAARSVKPAEQHTSRTSGVMIESLDLGERMFGENTATLTLHNPLDKAQQVSAALFLNDAGDAPTAAVAVNLAPGATTTVQLPYTLDEAAMRGTWTEQGSIRIDIDAGGNTRSVDLAYNTWPVIVDVDLYRHHPTPEENPQAVAINLGITKALAAKTKSLVIEMRHVSDGRVVDTVNVGDLAAALAHTRANLEDLSKNDFKTPNPVQFADRHNLVALRLDLGKLPVHPYDNPQRDHYLHVRGLDAQGHETFADDSQRFGRVEENQEVLPAITKTEARDDGAVLVNGEPVFMMAGNFYTCGHYALNPAQNKSMGHNAIRWVENQKQVEGNWAANLYSLETMIRKGLTDASPVADLKAELEQWKEAGALAGVVTISPYYEHSSVYGASRISDEKVAREKGYTQTVNEVANRITNWGGGGAHNLYTIEPSFDAWDSFGLEIEPFGPPRGGFELAPIIRRKGVPWFHLPQTYNNTPYDFFRFDQYVMILQGGRGFSTIHGLGDPSFMRGITGEIRYLSPAIFSRDHGDERTDASPNIWWMQRKVDDTTTIIALNKPAVEIGAWTWHDDADAPGGRAHSGVSEFEPWRTPDGIRLHGFREAKPVVIEAGDKIVQWVKVDAKDKPAAIAWGVRGDAKWDYSAHYGKPFDFAKWREEFVNFWFAGELLPGTWQIGWQYNDATKKWFADHIMTPQTFASGGDLPTPGQWTRLELSADEAGLVGKQIDGFYFLAQHGEAQWAHSAIVRGDEQIVMCGQTLHATPDQLAQTTFDVPWAPDGTTVKVLFEQRELTVKDGKFVDDLRGEDMFQTIRGAATGDAVGWHPRGTQLKAQTIGYVTPSGNAAVRVYEITPDK